MSFAERLELNCSHLTVLFSVKEVRHLLGYFTMTKQKRLMPFKIGVLTFMSRYPITLIASGAFSCCMRALD